MVRWRRKGGVSDDERHADLILCTRRSPLVSDHLAVQKLVNDIVKDFGRLDIMVANAGMAISKPILEQTVEEYRQQMAVNGEQSRLHMRAL